MACSGDYLSFFEGKSRVALSEELISRRRKIPGILNGQILVRPGKSDLVSLLLEIGTTLKVCGQHCHDDVW